MNVPSPTSSDLPPSRGIVRPVWFFIGLLLGLVGLAWLGHQAPRRDYHPNFTRFFPAIAPEASYYPTVEEMCAIVRARCRPDQILVIVGGNSVLHGVSQPADVLWTKKLQEQLGDRYCVVNFALRGAMPADGGAVIAEALRNEFPHQIYIANEAPARIFDSLGNEAYRVIFWQAYYGGYLSSLAPRDALVRAYQKDIHGDALAVTLTARLDRWLRFEDLWNRLAFERFNTVPSLYAPAPPATFSPRRLFVDEEPDGTTRTLDQRYLPAVRATEMTILRATSEKIYQRTPEGGWRWMPEARAAYENACRQAFPEALRPRTLLLIGRDSPFFRRQLSAEELARDEQVVRDSVESLHRCGYGALDYGTDFTPEDYSDRIHLAPSGGLKLATVVAAEVRSMAEKLHYHSQP